MIRYDDMNTDTSPLAGIHCKMRDSGGIFINRRVLEFIQALRDKGRSVLLVSHHVHQAYDVADRFLFMDKGKTVGEVRREGTSPADLTERLLSLAEGRGA